MLSDLIYYRYDTTTLCVGVQLWHSFVFDHVTMGRLILVLIYFWGLRWYILPPIVALGSGLCGIGEDGMGESVALDDIGLWSL